MLDRDVFRRCSIVIVSYFDTATPSSSLRSCSSSGRGDGARWQRQTYGGVCWPTARSTFRTLHHITANSGGSGLWPALTALNQPPPHPPPGHRLSLPLASSTDQCCLAWQQSEAPRSVVAGSLLSRRRRLTLPAQPVHRAPMPTDAAGRTQLNAERALEI